MDGDVAGKTGAGPLDIFGDDGGGHGGEGAGRHGGRRLDVEEWAVGRDAGAAGVVADGVVGGVEEEVVVPGGDEVAVVAVACGGELGFFRFRFLGGGEQIGWKVGGGGMEGNY